MQYIKEVIQRTAALAKNQCELGHFEVASQLMEAVDFDTAESLAPFVGDLLPANTKKVWNSS